MTPKLYYHHGEAYTMIIMKLLILLSKKLKILTFMALSINLESQAGSGGSWEICNGLEPSISSILMVTLCTGAVPVFLPRTC